MKKLVFVPLSDEMIYEHPELITGPIRAFSATQAASVERDAIARSSLGTVGDGLGTQHQRRPTERPVGGRVA